MNNVIEITLINLDFKRNLYIRVFENRVLYFMSSFSENYELLNFSIKPTSIKPIASS